MAIRQLLTCCRGLGLALFALGAASVAAGDGARPAFDQLLSESGLRLEHRGQFVDLAPRANPVLPYEHAMRHKSGDLEVRFIVRPLSRIMIEYNDPHNATPEPNHLFPLLFESITSQLSAGSDAPTSTFPESEAQQKFNANWAAAAAFDVNPEFAAGYRNAVLIGMHKNELADAYTLFLYNDHQRAKTLINDALSILSFAPQASQQ